MSTEETVHRIGHRLAASGVLLDRLLHDLKGPLNHIRVVAQDIRLDTTKDRLEVESLPEGMAEIETAVDQLALRIDRLRFLAKPRTATMLTRAVDVASFCRSALASIRATFPELKINATLEPNLWVGPSDPAALEQAVWELLDNAGRASQEAGRSPGVAEILAFVRGSDIVVGVRDNGCGVPADKHDEIFEPFFTTRDSAAGVGLSLAAAIAREVGGRIEVATSDENGSTFEMQLPADVGAAATSAGSR